MATVEVTDGAIAIATTDVTEAADPFGDRGEKSAVKQGVRHAIAARPSDGDLACGGRGHPRGQLLFDFERNGQAFGPGLRLPVSQLHNRAGTHSTYNKVRRGVEEGVRLYLAHNTIFGEDA